MKKTHTKTEAFINLHKLCFYAFCFIYLKSPLVPEYSGLQLLKCRTDATLERQVT